MEKIISVIIPVYNQIRYLENCINSLLVQLTDDIEILLIDDGSNDGSEEICDKAQRKSSNIKTIHKTNGGLSSARNEGIKNAKGEYLVFLDSDDELTENAIKILKNNIKIYSPDIIVYGYSYKRSDKYTLSGTGRVTEISQKDSIELLVTNNIGNQICFKAYNRKLFDSIEFPIGRNYEDIATFYKLLLKSKKNIIIDSSLYIYNLMNECSITQTFSEKNLRDMYDAINEFEKGLHEECAKINLDEYLEYYKRNIYVYIYLKAKTNGLIHKDFCKYIEKYLWSHNHYNLWKYRNFSVKKLFYFYLITVMRRTSIKRDGI